MLHSSRYIICIFVGLMMMSFLTKANLSYSSIFTAPLDEQIKGASHIFIGQIIESGLKFCEVRVIEQKKGYIKNSLIEVADFNTDYSFSMQVSDSVFDYMPYSDGFILKKDSLYCFFISSYDESEKVFKVSGGPNCGIFRVNGNNIEYDASNFCANGINTLFAEARDFVSFYPISDFEELIRQVLMYDSNKQIERRYIARLWIGLRQSLDCQRIYPVRHWIAVLAMFGELKYNSTILRVVREGTIDDKVILAEYIGNSAEDREMMKVLKQLASPKENEDVRMTALWILKSRQW